MLEFLRPPRSDEDPLTEVVVEREDDGVWAATSPSLPGYVAYGTSDTAALRKLRRAIRRNMDGLAADWARTSNGGTTDRTSRHRTSLHFRLPLTTPAKIVLGVLALAAAAGVVQIATRRKD